MTAGRRAGNRYGYGIMAPKKGSGTTSKKKKTTAGKKPAPKAQARRAPAPAAAPGNRTAVYLLVILALLAVIVYLATFVFFQDRPGAPRGQAAKQEQKDGTRERTDRPGERERADAKKMDADVAKGEPKEKTDPERLVKIFLIRIDDRTEKFSLSPVARRVKGEVSVQQAMTELIKGPTAAEKRRGLLTAVPPGLRVRSVTVKNRIAEIDFNEAIEQNAAGSILIGRLDQIVFTATELGGVDSVIIKINGRQRQSLGGDGLSIGGPLHRRQ